MKARSRPLLLAAGLAAAFAALVAVALHGVERPDEAARERHAASTRALPFAPADAVALSVAPRTGPEVRLERSGAGWRVTAPQEAPANAQAVEGLLDRLAAVRLRGAASASAPGSASSPAALDPRALGLDPPLARVRVGLRDGTALTLDVGDENPFDRTRYCRSGGVIRLADGVPGALLDPALAGLLSAPGGG